jgi:fucose permease
LFLYVGAEVGINSWIATYLNRTFQLDIRSLATLGLRAVTDRPFSAS